MSVTDLVQATAAELSGLYQTGDASPVETIRAILERAAAINPRINALCRLDAENALEAARASERRWMSGRPLSPLDGVPASIKELVRVRGWPTLMGSKLVDPDRPAEEDAPVVERLRAAGVVVFAQSTSPEYGHKGVTDSPLHGVTRNPWALDRTPGGSSGGASAAVAAGLGPLAIGTDGGGSIRIPASFTGLFGLKPTFGRVPMWPPSLTGDLANTGPITRTAEDAAMMMNVIARPDARDPWSLPATDIDYVEQLKQGIRHLRVGLVLKLGHHSLDPEVASAVTAAARWFAQAGCSVEEAVPDLGGIDGGLLFETLWLCLLQAVRRLHPPEKHHLFDPTLAWMARRGATFTSSDLVAAMADRRTVALGWNKLLVRHDLLLCPTLAVVAFETGRLAPLGADGKTNPDWSPYAHHFNFSRHPAGTVPCGVSTSGLPIGVMIVAAHYRDSLVMRAAHAYQSSHGWPRAPKLPTAPAQSE
jgi:aspartyl-tRNA(Asn)/glutamyl-tRNA(Gln) amidotransferase subunit A